MYRSRALFLLAVVAAAAVLTTAQDPSGLLEKADRQFLEKNYRDAAAGYRAMLDAGHAKLHHANRRLVLCFLRLQQFDDALEAAEKQIARTKGTPHEARAERAAGNLYLTVPHWGTRAGGKFHRARWKQGIRVRSNTHDKKRALGHLQRARVLYAGYDREGALQALPEAERATWHDERIDCIFDLAAACGRFGIYESEWRFWYAFWGERDDFLAETAGERDFDEYYGSWQLRRRRPIGLRVTKAGDPIFPTAAAAWSDDLPDDRKILFLLEEARRLDRSKDKRFTAMSYYRQAMLARSRFGMDRLNGYAGIYHWGGRYPLKQELEELNPWEMKDDEGLVLAGGKIRRVTLPAQWDVLRLLRLVARDYKASGLADEAQYAVGLYHQSRQQYTRSIAEYGQLAEAHGKSAWANHGRRQVERIRAPQVRISQTGVQLPKEPARLQLSHRNTAKIWFVARRVDHLGFMNELRGGANDKGQWRHQWSLNSWHGAFVRGYDRRNEVQRIASRYIGGEVARWADPVQDDGTHRYKEAELQTPLEQAGAYVVYAYVAPPPQEDARKRGGEAMNLGTSRAVVVLTDLALVEKQAGAGRLYFVCDARAGAPVKGAKLSILETWSVYDRARKRSIHHREMHDFVTDGQGLSVFEKTRSSRLHVMVHDGPRLAWSGMRYWGRYSPSRMRSGLFAYCITDRPVYRPDQTVHFKVWLRQMKDGIFENRPDHRLTLTVHDPRGNKVHQAGKTTDQFGGLDGEFRLGEEPALGMYRLRIEGQRYVGGQNFRVEEYRKPEFEVSVEPGKKHGKLGEKLTATIKASYYFGGPVTDATVHYKVFREEYRFGYHFPGGWDWLYGPGYGLSWYDHGWYPWWGIVRRCRVAPAWWWGWSGYRRANPVRELVTEGDGPIGPEGKLDLIIDTKAAQRDHPDRDHRYVVQAEVRDASRRVITGEGAVKVTRQAFYAIVQADRGYYRPGEEMVVKVRCLTPDNEPVQAAGVVTVSEVVFGGAGNARIEETRVKTWKASTDERGLLEFRLRHEKSGQLKIRFSTPDSWGGVVDGYGLVWVCGRDFDGEVHRFNDLELITDKRTYQPGEVAHVMINTKRSDSYVLFSDKVDSNHLLSWKLLHLPKRHTVVEIPIRREHAPNFFVEATTVAGTRVHQQAKRICVPPESGIVQLSVTADEAEYGPGDRASVEVTATTPDGKPARAQVTLSAFDKSVLYIQEELTPSIARFFHGNLRHHSMRSGTNLLEQFSAWGQVYRPFQQLHPYPSSWRGVWGPMVRDWRTVGDRDLEGLAKGKGASLKSELGADGFADGRGGPGGEVRGRKRRAQAPGAPAREESGKADGDAGGDGPGGLVEAEVRKRFADTALWLTTLVTGEDGKAHASFDMPDNLTTWKINAWGMTRETRVGHATTSTVTTKDLLVRLQAPRFFLEFDQVVVSANVHNYLQETKAARVSLEVADQLLELVGETPAAVEVKVGPGGEARVDWRVRVLSEGVARILVKARTDEESDAMQMTFPVYVHGMTKQIATTGSMRPGDTAKTATVELAVPEKRRPELTRLEVQFAPSLVGAMLDALPYCLDYPYGCTEQTMSRFLPAVLTLKTLQDMGIRLADVARIRRGRMEEIRRVEKGENIKLHGSYSDSPIFDEDEMRRIVARGLSRIANMQNGDGGWGWWTGNQSSGYLTCYVLYALATAQRCDVAVPQKMLQRGMAFLRGWEQRRMAEKPWSPHASHAFAAYVLSLAHLKAAIDPSKGDERPGDLVDRLWKGRDKLNLYGKALLCLTLSNHGTKGRAQVVLQNILQYKEENADSQVAWFRLPRGGWWYWWNSDIETHAWILRALVRLEPRSELAPRIVKWLLNNRRNGYYWRSTRDTTLCLAAMSEFVRNSGEGRPDYTLRLDLDNGAVVKEVKIDKDTFFTYDNRFVVEGVALGGGKHTLKITKAGKGALYFNTYLRYFTKEKPITAAGHELKVERSYFRLERIPYETDVEGSQGEKVQEKRLRYKRVPVGEGDAVESGDVLQVELRVKSDNNYTYLAFEDPKPAGCEPTQVRSGGKGQEGFFSYMELRDEKVVFFVRALGQGEHLLRYRLRAEIPGLFHALPAKLFAMYVPELRANSDEQVIRILD